MAAYEHQLPVATGRWTDRFLEEVHDYIFLSLPQRVRRLNSDREEMYKGCVVFVINVPRYQLFFIESRGRSSSSKFRGAQTWVP